MVGMTYNYHVSTIKVSFCFKNVCYMFITNQPYYRAISVAV